jgi:hypothetical protein
MALAIGTNIGFVASAPVGDPTGGTGPTIDAAQFALKDTSPVGAGKITEIGWWCDGATQEANFEVGLYDHNAGSNKPDSRLFVDAVNAKGTGSGWKTVAVDWTIDPSTIYWLAVQLDNTATATQTDGETGVSRQSIKTSSTTLEDPWSAFSFQANNAYAIYAVWDAGVTYSELSGTIAGVSVVEAADLEVKTFSELAGTIAATSVVESASLGQTAVSLGESIAISRLIAVGNDRFYYEDI